MVSPPRRAINPSNKSPQNAFFGASCGETSRAEDCARRFCRSLNMCSGSASPTPRRSHPRVDGAAAAAALPPKSGLNRMSYPFISLSTVSFTRGMLLGSLISLMLRREDGGVKYLAHTGTHTHAHCCWKRGQKKTKKHVYLWP